MKIMSKINKPVFLTALICGIYLQLLSQNSYSNWQIGASHFIGFEKTIFSKPNYSSKKNIDQFSIFKIQSWIMSSTQLSSSYCLGRKFWNFRLGADVSSEKSLHGLPIINDLGTQYGFFVFGLRRTSFKLTLSHQFNIYNKCIFLEPKIKLVRMKEQFDRDYFSVENSPSNNPAFDYDMELVVWRDYYRTNSTFGTNAYGQYSYEFEVSSLFKLKESFFLSLNFGFLPKRYFMYNFNYQLRERSASNPDEIIQEFYGSDKTAGTKYTTLGSRNDYFTVGLGLVYRPKKKSLIKRSSNKS